MVSVIATYAINAMNGKRWSLATTGKLADGWGGKTKFMATRTLKQSAKCATPTLLGLVCWTNEKRKSFAPRLAVAGLARHPWRFYAVFTESNGGINQAPWDSLNLGDHVGDAPQAVMSNRQLFAAQLEQLAACPVTPRTPR